MLEVLIMGGDDTERATAYKPLENGFCNGSTYGGFGTSTEFIYEEQAGRIGAAHHLLHILQVAAIGTEVILDALFVTYVDKNMLEDTAYGVLSHGDG